MINYIKDFPLSEELYSQKLKSLLMPVSTDISEEIITVIERYKVVSRTKEYELCYMLRSASFVDWN